MITKARKHEMKQMILRKNPSSNRETFRGSEEEFLAIKDFHCKIWKLNGKHHREDGPAFISSDGYRAWYKDGIRHREDGSAVTWIDGDNQKWFFMEKTTTFLNDLFPMSYWICGY